MSALKDLTGQCFGKLTVVSRAPNRLIPSGVRKISRVMWLCACSCGSGKDVLAATGSLVGGNTQSCGCKRLDTLAADQGARDISKHPLYARWAGMIQRCTNHNHIGYENYGGRGVVVCERWRNSFLDFLKDMGDMPGRGYSIERKENDGNYEPGNCVWATKGEQSRNTCRNRWIEIGGVTLTVRDWEKERGFKRGAIQRRIDLGWNPEQAVLEPITKGKPLRKRL